MARTVPYPDVDLEAVRAHARWRVRKSTVRGVASEMGVNHSTLHTFLHGREPGPTVRAELCGWYFRELDDGRDAEAALTILSRFVTGAEQQRALRNELLDHVADAFRKTGRDVPRWVARMKQ